MLYDVYLQLLSTKQIVNTCRYTQLHQFVREWGSHVQLTHFYDSLIGNLSGCRKCYSVEHANPTLRLLFHTLWDPGNVFSIQETYFENFEWNIWPLLIGKDRRHRKFQLQHHMVSAC